MDKNYSAYNKMRGEEKQGTFCLTLLSDSYNMWVILDTKEIRQILRFHPRLPEPETLQKGPCHLCLKISSR